MKYKKKHKTPGWHKCERKGSASTVESQWACKLLHLSKEQSGKKYHRIKTVNLPCNLITKAFLFKKIIKMCLKIYNKDVHHFLIRLFIINQSEES